MAAAHITLCPPSGSRDHTSGSKGSQTMWHSFCGHHGRRKRSCGFQRRQRPSARATCSEKRSAAAAWASFARKPQTPPAGAMPGQGKPTAPLQYVPPAANNSNRPPLWLINTVALAAVTATVFGFGLGVRIAETVRGVDWNLEQFIHGAANFYMEQPFPEIEQLLMADSTVTQHLGTPVQIQKIAGPVTWDHRHPERLELLLSVNGPQDAGQIRCQFTLSDERPVVEQIQFLQDGAADHMVFQR